MDFLEEHRPNPSPEIEYIELSIPDTENFGTGSFVTRVRSRALLAGKSVSSLSLHAPYFQLSINLNPATGKVPILLGRADGTSPVSRKVFLLPQHINHNTPHNFTVKFQDWSITAFMMDTLFLEEDPLVVSPV